MPDPGPDQESVDRTRELLLKASQGDEHALESLLQRHLPGLRAYVRLRAGPLVRARESCSDLVQSVCRELLGGAGEFEYRGEAAFRHWLFQAALRKLVARQRFHLADKRDARLEREGGPADLEERHQELLRAYSGIHTPSRMAVANEEVERIERAFSRLSEEHREVITNSRLLGMSHAELAKQMGKSEGSVRILLHRALARLAGLLE